MINPITMTSQPFSWKARVASFSFAFRGIVAFFRTEHNAWIHGGLTVLVLVLSIVLKISKTEFILLVLAMTPVWMAELFNTAIEKAMDFISIEQHQQIKLVKDLAAAAVLIAAIAALLIGCIVFIPKILQYA